jgi:hypothetical protein
MNDYFLLIIKHFSCIIADNNYFKENVFPFISSILFIYISETL